MTPERKDRTRFLGREIRLMAGLLALGVVMGVAGALIWRAQGELSRIFVTATVTLIFGALLGGVVSLLIADFDRRRVQRAAQMEFVSNILSELKAVYDRVDRGRTLIAAHQSAKTYGEQMQGFIDARVKLLAVDRALKFDERGTPLSLVRKEVRKMEKYLHSLTREFVAHYKDISRAQSVYEARMKAALDSSADLPRNLPWEEILALKQIQDFLLPIADSATESETEENSKALPSESSDNSASDYSEIFLDSLDRASEMLRQALEAELRGDRPSLKSIPSPGSEHPRS